jgi:hypothetical protein
VKVAGGGPSVHACAVFFRAKSRDGDKLGQTPYIRISPAVDRRSDKLRQQEHLPILRCVDSTFHMFR